MARNSGGPPTHHVVPYGAGWAVRRGGASRVSETFGTKREAIDRGRQIASNAGTEFRIHNRDGRIAASDSHGNDPYPPKG